MLKVGLNKGVNLKCIVRDPANETYSINPSYKLTYAPVVVSASQQSLSTSTTPAEFLSSVISSTNPEFNGSSRNAGGLRESTPAAPISKKNDTNLTKAAVSYSALKSSSNKKPKSNLSQVVNNSTVNATNKSDKTVVPSTTASLTASAPSSKSAIAASSTSIVDEDVELLRLFEEFNKDKETLKELTLKDSFYREKEELERLTQPGSSAVNASSASSSSSASSAVQGQDQHDTGDVAVEDMDEEELYFN